MTTDQPNQAQKPKSGLLLVVAGALASILTAAIVAYIFAERGLAASASFTRMLRPAELVAIPASGAVLAAIIFAANRLGRPFNANLAMALILGGAVLAPFAVITAEGKLYARAEAKTAPVLALVRSQVLARKQVYDRELATLKPWSLNQPGAIQKGGAAVAREHMDQALAADARYQGEVAAIVRTARPQLQAVSVSARQSAMALKAFDFDFTDPGGPLKQLTAYQTWRLTLMDDELKRLSTQPWHFEGRLIVFADPASEAAYVANHGKLLRAESELESLSWQFANAGR